MPTPPYQPRIVDLELDELLRSIAAIAIEGPKAVGKTVTAARRAETVHRLDAAGIRAIAMADPTVLLNDPPPVLLDEWQHVPTIWDAVRRAVDAGAVGGRFLLTGSATPQTAPAHSGAGRIVRVRMRPLSLAERGLDEPSVSLSALLDGRAPTVSGTTRLGLAEYAREIVASGFPGIRTLEGRSRRSQLDGYIERIVDREFTEQGYPVRRPAALRRWLTAYAAATATTTTLEKIRNAAAAGDEGVPARSTVSQYRDVLERLWLLEPIPGWIPSKNRLKRLTQHPKHHLAEPALAARLVGVDERALLGGLEAGADVLDFNPTHVPARDSTFLGQLFESLVAQSVLVYAQWAEARVHHLRTYDGEREVDLIVERPDQRLVAMEVKTAADVTDGDVRHLLWLREAMGSLVCALVVVTTGTHAYTRPDGVIVVPAVLLGP